MNRYSFFCNRDCEYYPCHEAEEPLNCLFCFCPLYSFKDCGGHFSLTDKGVKDCTNCLLPHQPGGYGTVIRRLTRSHETEGNNE